MKRLPLAAALFLISTAYAETTMKCIVRKTIDTSEMFSATNDTTVIIPAKDISRGSHQISKDNLNQFNWVISSPMNFVKYPRLGRRFTMLMEYLGDLELNHEIRIDYEIRNNDKKGALITAVNFNPNRCPNPASCSGEMSNIRTSARGSIELSVSGVPHVPAYMVSRDYDSDLRAPIEVNLGLSIQCEHIVKENSGKH